MQKNSTQNTLQRLDLTRQMVDDYDSAFR